MRNLLALLLCVPFAACDVGDPNPPPTGGDEVDAGDGSGSSNNPVNITANETWTAPTSIDVQTTIDPGVTVTVAAGVPITFGPMGRLIVAGTFDVQGTAAAKVTLASRVATETYGGIQLPVGGTLNMTYAVQSGGIINFAGGTATIIDSSFSNPGGPSTRGDFFVMNGGTLTMSFSEIGLATGDGTHCQLHFNNGFANMISITNSVIRGVPYGLMFYGGNNAIFTNNNWENPINVSTQPGVSGDFSGSYFMGVAPDLDGDGGANLTVDNLSATPLLGVGPRP